MELKGPSDSSLGIKGLFPSAVPNLPCGVESIRKKGKCHSAKSVPNLPCGVESPNLPNGGFGRFTKFLIYRVELKETRNGNTNQKVLMFLIYRVELKVNFMVAF